MSGRLIPGHHFYQSQSRGMDSQSETRKSSDVQIIKLISMSTQLLQDVLCTSKKIRQQQYTKMQNHAINVNDFEI
jgi:hypothetical protein